MRRLPYRLLSPRWGAVMPCRLHLSWARSVRCLLLVSDSPTALTTDEVVVMLTAAVLARPREVERLIVEK